MSFFLFPNSVSFNDTLDQGIWFASDLFISEFLLFNDTLDPGIVHGDATERRWVHFQALARETSCNSCKIGDTISPTNQWSTPVTLKKEI